MAGDEKSRALPKGNYYATENMTPIINTLPDKEYMYHLLYLPRGTERLEKLGETIVVPKDTYINAELKIPDYCYVLKKGRVIGCEYTYSGDQRIYNIMEENSVFLEECLLNDLPCPVFFRTLTECELVRIAKCDLKRACKHDIDVVMDVCQSITSKFLSSMEYVRLGPHTCAELKICKLLWMYAQHHGTFDGNKTVTFDKKVSHQMLADIFGMNRVTVSRKMSEFKDMGIIATNKDNRIVINIPEMQKYMSEL